MRKSLHLILVIFLSLCKELFDIIEFEKCNSNRCFFCPGDGFPPDILVSIVLIVFMVACLLLCFYLWLCVSVHAWLKIN